MKIEPNSKVVVIGDSITDCERARPVGEGLFDAIGKGWVSLADALLKAAYPQENIRMVNMGVNGNTVRDLKARWQSDVIALKPDWLVVLIGINDVWRHFDSPQQAETHVGLDEYHSTLDALIAAVRPSLKGAVLMTPFYIEPNRRDAMRAKMDQYGAAMKQIANKHKAIEVDTQAAFDAFLEHGHANALAWDRVHPNRAGHMIIARAFLNAVNFRWH